MEVVNDNYGFFGWFSQDSGKFDSISVVVEKSTKSAHFTSVIIEYSSVKRPI